MIEFSVGQQLCHCTLLQRCGFGAYGEVWLARDDVGARVAVKIVSNGGRYSEREIAGLRNYRKCDHQNLLRVRHIEISPDYLVYTMDAADDLNHGHGEYLPDTLGNRLRKFNRLDGSEIYKMLDGLLAGLEELHHHKLVHRDIKPDNILWVNGRPSLADAGLITQAGAGSLVGTPGFLSPRLLSGKCSAEPADDFYALGKVIYCALTGNPVERYPSIPRELTLSGNADWNRLFSDVCEHPVVSAKDFREKMQFSPASRHYRFWVIGIAVLLLALIGLLIFFLLPHTPANTANPVKPKKLVMTPNVIKEIHPVKRHTLTGYRKIKEVTDAVIQKWNDANSPVMSALRTAGLYDTEMLDELLKVPYCSQSYFFMRLEKCINTPRMYGFPPPFVGKKPSPLEKELIKICRDYREISYNNLRDRKLYWHVCKVRNRNGDKLSIQRTMLAEDSVMQMVAFDYLTFKKIDDILASGKLEDGDRELLTKWIQLKNKLFH